MTFQVGHGCLFPTIPHPALLCVPCNEKTSTRLLLLNWVGIGLYYGVKGSSLQGLTTEGPQLRLDVN